jgi:hypothetical protein
MKDSFLPGAITAIATQKNKYYAALADYIIGHTSNDTNLEQAYAKAAFDIKNDRRYYPIQIASFAQYWMDKAMWNARKLYTARRKHEASPEIYGIDRANAVVELVGVNIDADNILKHIESDYDHLLLMHTAACQVNNLHDVDNLLPFNPSTKEGDEWVQLTPAYTVQEAFDLMDQISDDLNNANEQAQTKLKEFNRLMLCA